MLLSELSVGQTAVVTRVGGDGALRQHFLDMGLIPGAEVTLVKFAPMGDPMELRLHGYELTLRLDDAARIETKNLSRRRHLALATHRTRLTAKAKAFSLITKRNTRHPLKRGCSSHSSVTKTAEKPRSLTSSRAPTNTSAIFRASPSTVKPAF